MTSQVRWVVLAVGALAAAAIVVATRFEVGGDITAFLPADADDERVEISRTLARSSLGRRMIVLVHGPAESVAAATRRLADALEDSDELEWVQSGLGAASEPALREVFFPARMGFLTDRPEELDERLSDRGLAAAAVRLKELLSSPLGASIRSTVGSDPLLAYRSILERAQRARPGEIDLEDGAFVTTTAPRRGVIFLATAASPFDAAAQRRALAAIEARGAELGPLFSVEMSGVNVLAVDGERSMRADVKRISVVSLLGTTLLFLLCFRRLRHVIALAVPIGFGLAGGVAVSLLLFGEIHGMTLAFGATLIGVSVDYVIHYLSHHLLEPREPRASLAMVWPGIALGGATTIVGFIAMGLTSTPGMQQIAVFGSSGIAFALLATYALLPLFVRADSATPGGLDRVRRRIGAGLAVLGRHRGAIAILAGLIAVGAAVALPRLEWDDNPRALATFNQELSDRDERIRSVVSSADPGRFVVARGGNWEEALAANDAAAVALEDAVRAGELTGYSSLHQLLWSVALQRQNMAAVWRAPDLAARLASAMEAVGFRREAFAELADHLAAARPKPVMPGDVIGGPLGPLVRGFFVEHEGGVMLLSPLTGVGDPAALNARLAGLARVTYFDQDQFLEDSYGGFRRRVLAVVGLSLSLVLALVLVRYRRPRPALAAFAPAVVAAAAALAALGLLGVTLNLVHVVGLMLVLSIGVDYGVFVVEASRRGRHIDVAVVGTAISCATTLLAFGLLAMSDNPALRALGSITALGCFLSVLLAPAALAAAGETRDER